LKEGLRAAIKEVLASYPEVEEAILYGSRVLGHHRPASDIDLTLVGPALTSGTLAARWAERQTSRRFRMGVPLRMAQLKKALSRPPLRGSCHQANWPRWWHWLPATPTRSNAPAPA
jgi:predicted nucleotidyltransferase